MSIEIAEIDDSQLAKLLNLQESHFYEAKSKRVSPAKMTKTMSGFANANGGELYVGLEESETSAVGYDWDGFENPEAANAHIQVCDDLFSLGRFFEYEFLTHPSASGFVLHVTVLKTREVKEASNGKPYVRRSAQSIPADSPKERRRLKLDKGIVSFEDETVGVSHEIVTNSEVVLRFMLDVIPSSAEPKTWLEKQWLLRGGNPTVAAVMLFSDIPQAVLPKRSAIKIYRYKTREEEGKRETLAFDPITIEGCVYNQIFESVKKTVSLVEDIKVLSTEGFESVEYPHETLHEVITNAVLHRDYSIATDIHIKIYDNRIEVESPGKLPGHVTKANILDEFARNASIVRIINKFPNPPNKDIGEGLNTAFEAMRKLRLKEPSIEETDSSVVVEIRHETLASPEEAVMEYLESHDEIQNRDARKITGITSENTMKNVFYRLRDSGLLERVPGKKGPKSAWRKVQEGVAKED
jgi:ATP-dependent DNA helicase RecG